MKLAQNMQWTIGNSYYRCCKNGWVVESTPTADAAASEQAAANNDDAEQAADHGNTTEQAAEDNADAEQAATSATSADERAIETMNNAEISDDDAPLVMVRTEPLVRT